MYDMHMHYPKDGDVARLMDAQDRVGIEKAVMLAAPALYNAAGGNDAVERVAREHPDRFVPFGYVNLDEDDACKVAQLRDRGFRGLKLISPRRNYDHEAYFPVYEQATTLGMPMLFHTGIVAATPDDAAFGASSARMRPIYLDTIGRAFPKATVIGAHLGDPWMAEACETARWVANVTFDLSGLMYSTLASEVFQTLVWRGNMHEFFPQHSVTDLYDKVLFGTDVPTADIEWVTKAFIEYLDALGLDAATREKVLFGNARRVLGE